eukprot:3853593-Rhodomonas_salina.1
MESNKRKKVDPHGLTSVDEEAVRWLIENNAGLKDLQCHRGPMGMSVLAARDLAKGDLVVTLPNSLVLTAEIAWESEAGNIVRDAGIECSDEMMLWVYMAIERGGKGHWAPYLNALPDTAPIPTTWEEDFLMEELGGTSLYSIVKVSSHAQLICQQMMLQTEARGHCPSSLPLDSQHPQTGRLSERRSRRSLRASALPSTASTDSNSSKCSGPFPCSALARTLPCWLK